MERIKFEKEQDKMNIEQVLKEKGYLMTLPFGTSMLPFIRPQRDIIVVRCYEGEAELSVFHFYLDKSVIQ